VSQIILSLDIDNTVSLSFFFKHSWFYF